MFNDIDGDLVNLYRQIKENCEQLQKEIDWLHSRELFKLFRYEIENEIPLTDLQRAARYLYLIKHSFGSNRYSFATAAKGTANIIEDLPAYRERLKNVVIEQTDFEQLIKTYDRPSALFYIDPPYFGSERYYNKKYCRFTIDDHARLSHCLHGLKGRFILSYNDCDFVREHYGDFQIRGISRKNLLPAATPGDDYKEVIITNY